VHSVAKFNVYKNAINVSLALMETASFFVLPFDKLMVTKQKGVKTKKIEWTAGTWNARAHKVKLLIN